MYYNGIVVLVALRCYYSCIIVLLWWWYYSCSIGALWLCYNGIIVVLW